MLNEVFIQAIGAGDITITAFSQDPTVYGLSFEQTAIWEGKFRNAAQAAKQGALNPNFGHNRSAEVINRIRVNHPHTKRVYQYDLDRITLISQYDSIRQAAEFTGVSRNYITRCLNQGELVHGKWFFSITPPA